MANPFDDPEARFLVLVNAEGQYSLWPAATEVPAGWRQAHPVAGYQECVDHIERQWGDMRPQSLTEATHRN
jgi:MbtH protein